MRSPFRRRLATGLAAMALVGGVAVAGPAGVVHAADVTLTFLNVNDFHGRIDPANDLTTKWATTIEQQRALDPTGTLLLGAGDLIGASLFNSAVQNDQPTIDVMNELCLNASSVGNHEFDKGYADLTGRVLNGPAGAVPAPACQTFAGDHPGGTNALWSYLGANVYQKGTTNPALPQYATFVVKGVTVGIIGAVTSETPALVSPGGITQIDIGDPVAAVNRVAAQLTDGNPANGEAQVLIAEYHEGAPDGTQSLAANVAAGPAFASIVNQTSSRVAVIFTGHTHQAYAYDAPIPGVAGKTRPVLQTGSYADHVGKVTLTVDDTTGAVSTYTQANLLPAAAANLALPRVAAVKATVDAAKAFADTIGLQPIGTQTADITTAYTGGAYTGPNGTYVVPGGTNSTTGRDDRASESTIGDTVANSLRDTLAPVNLGGAQIGVTNPGGLRSELFYKQTGAEGAGVITFAEANNVLPFVNNLWTTTLTGAQFKTLLEQQWQRDASGVVPTRPYLQLGLSDNVTYTFDASLPEGSRITSITINGAPYNPAASYRVGTFSFLATGGDNFRIFTSGINTKDSGLIDRDGWIAYLGAHSPVAPDFARQAVAVSKTPSTASLGGHLTFTVSGLNLTSVGSPANTYLAVTLGGKSLGVVPVANGTAGVDLAVPMDVPTGAQTLTAIASPTGTTVTLPVTVVDPVAQRLVDTRIGVGLPKAPLPPGKEVRLDVRGKFGVAADAKSVVLNLTAVGATDDGWVRAYPCGTPPTGETSNLNPSADHIVANVAVVPLDSTGAVCFMSYQTTDLVVDLQRWDPAGSDFQPTRLTRIADTRTGVGITAKLTPFNVVQLQVAGLYGVAANASAAVMNLTAVADVPGWVTAFPCGSPVPTASNVNAWPDHAIANTAFTAIGTGGKICLVSNITSDLVIDLQGWFPAGSTYHSFSPVRALDTRDAGAPVTPGNVRVVPIAGLYGVPANASLVSVNVTAVDATGPAWVKVFPCGHAIPDASNNNTSPDRIVAASALVPIGGFGSICVAANWTTDIVVDVEGWQ